MLIDGPMANLVPQTMLQTSSVLVPDEAGENTMPIRAAPHAHAETPLRWSQAHIALLLAFWIAIFLSASWSPSLLDDADATHAQAAQAMLHTGDWVTLHVDGIRYLEKPPLPYWIAAISLRLFGNDSFAIHLPLALTVLALALLGYAWSRRAFGATAALYTGVFVLTSAGVFLFTRIFIPDALLSVLLVVCLYAFLRALEPGCIRPRLFAYGMWVALALAVLTKGSGRDRVLRRCGGSISSAHS